MDEACASTTPVIEVPRSLCASTAKFMCGDAAVTGPMDGAGPAYNGCASDPVKAYCASGKMCYDDVAAGGGCGVDGVGAGWGVAGNPFQLCGEASVCNYCFPDSKCGSKPTATSTGSFKVSYSQTCKFIEDIPDLKSGTAMKAFKSMVARECSASSASASQCRKTKPAEFREILKVTPYGLNKVYNAMKKSLQDEEAKFAATPSALNVTFSTVCAIPAMNDVCSKIDVNLIKANIDSLCGASAVNLANCARGFSVDQVTNALVAYSIEAAAQDVLGMRRRRQLADRAHDDDGGVLVAGKDTRRGRALFGAEAKATIGGVMAPFSKAINPAGAMAIIAQLVSGVKTVGKATSSSKEKKKFNAQRSQVTTDVEGKVEPQVVTIEWQPPQEVQVGELFTVRTKKDELCTCVSLRVYTVGPCIYA